MNFDFYVEIKNRDKRENYGHFYNVQKQFVFGQKAKVKDYVYRKQQKIKNIPKSKAEQFSGIYQSVNDFKKYIENLPKYSFGLLVEIELTEPYYSADDDPFYPVNPVMKEHTWKVPMVRGSSWKGALASVFKSYIIPSNQIEGFKSFARIFGLGSDEFRKIFNDDKQKAKQALLSYALFDLGIDNFRYNNKENLLDKILEKKESYLLPHKGRLVIYPTYFDRLSLEIINPHSRKTRAGTIPVQYEVVPRGAKGKLQMVYIPFDAVLEEDNKVLELVDADLDNIKNALDLLQSEGIGAKTKLGWGQFKINNLEKSFIKNF